MIVKCVHCDVEAYYRFIIEDFNNVGSHSDELCLKCIKAEAWKVISDFPATKFLKIELFLSGNLIQSQKKCSIGNQPIYPVSVPDQTPNVTFLPSDLSQN